MAENGQDPHWPRASLLRWICCERLSAAALWAALPGLLTFARWSFADGGGEERPTGPVPCLFPWIWRDRLSAAALCAALPGFFTSLGDGLMGSRQLSDEISILAGARNGQGPRFQSKRQNVV